MSISVDGRTTAVDGDITITTGYFLNFSSAGVINVKLTAGGSSAVKDWDDAKESNICEFKFNELTPAIDEACLTM